jgi:hypothetical protein
MTWIKLFNREVKLRPFVLSSTLRKIRGKWRDGKYTGRIVITGKVEITNGPKHAGPYRNHFVNYALWALGNILVSSSGATLYPNSIYLGTDTTIRTNPSMTVLVAPIGSSPGTGPNTWNNSKQNLSNGSSVTISATWNPGTVSGTIGEMALYGSAAGQSGNVMLSRISVADGDFSAFTINASYPLVVSWTVQFLFS